MRPVPAAANTTARLTGRRALIVEDEFFIADDLAIAVREAGVEVVGPVSTAAQALALLDSDDGIDVAILDINLHGELSFDVADRLRERRIPFAFATGYGEEAIPAEYRDVPRWEKPYSVSQLLRGLLRKEG